MKPRFACLLTFSLCLTALAPTARAQGADPLEAFPDTVAFVIRFDSVDKFLGNVNDMLSAIGPVAAAVGPNVEGAVLGEMFDLRERTGAIDRKSPGYIALFPIVVGGPPVAGLVKVEDEKDVQRAVLRSDDLEGVTTEKLDNGFTRYAMNGRSCFITHWNEYIIYTRSEEVAKLMALGQEDRRTMAQVLDDRAKKVYQAGDASIAVNSAHLATKFKAEIEAGRTQILQTIEGLPEEQLGPSAEATKKLYVEMVNFGFEALFDSTWVVGRANLSAAGAEAESLAGFKQDSKTDKYLASHPTSTFETLGLLPANGPLLFGLAMDYAKFTEVWLQAGLSGGVKDRMAADKAMKQMREAAVTSTVVSYALPSGDEKGLEATTYQEAGDAAKLRLGFLNYMKSIGELKSPVFSMKYDFKEAAETYKAHNIDLMTMKFELGDSEPAALLKDFYARLFGGDEFQSRIATVGSILVQSTGNNTNRIREVLDGLSSGEGIVALEEPFGKTRDKLAEESNLLLMIDAPRLIVSAVNMIRDVEPFAAGLRTAPFNFGIQPPASYSGLSVGVEPQGLRGKAFIPIEQPRWIMRIFIPAL